ncbi:MAG: PhnD/SsuA/transferrin family substrate-binding protein [Tepidisphaeraceae bacterium]|jgi:phosphonate transport system substrate-binding protein
MSDGSGISQSTNSQPTGGGLSGTWALVILFLCLIAAVLFVGNEAVRTMQARDSEKQTEEKTVQSAGLIAPAAKGLAARFTDSQGRLLADPPAQPDQLLDPDVLVVAHISGDSESPGTNWAQFEKYLSQVTGKKVSDRQFDNSADQLADISKGNIHVLALHAADTPFLVNEYGFEPAAVLGDDSGVNGNHLDIIVPAASAVARPADLKGHSLLCTVPASITGYRAAVALLMQNEQMRPNVDYFIAWSMGQKRSIMGVIKGQYDSAAVSNDKLQSLVDDGTVEKSQFKVVYESEVIPRTTMGWFYNLKPDLAEKVRQAILGFKPAVSKAIPAADSDAADSPDNSTSSPQLHFIPVDYKKDFQLVRWIDDSFDPRLDAKTKSHATPTTAP